MSGLDQFKIKTNTLTKPENQKYIAEYIKTIKDNEILNIISEGGETIFTKKKDNEMVRDFEKWLDSKSW